MISTEALIPELKNPLLVATTLAEIGSVLNLASSYRDRWGRCVILSPAGVTFTLDQLTQKVRRLAPTYERSASVLDKLYFTNIMFKMSQLIASSDKQYQEQRSSITRLFLSCFCCTCLPSKDLSDLQKLNAQIIQESSQGCQADAEFAPDDDPNALVLN